VLHVNETSLSITSNNFSSISSLLGQRGQMKNMKWNYESSDSERSKNWIRASKLFNKKLSIQINL